MRISLRALAAILLALALGTAAGCLARFGYGSIQAAPQDKSIQDLVSNWQDYHVSYSGLHPGQPSGLMFDPRYDDRELSGKRWLPVQDRETLDEIVMWLRQNDTYRPRLLRLMGPEGVLYGYVYTGWHQVVARAVDTRTMYVFDLPAPLPDEFDSPNR
ncbi:MAG: hypothetical protein K9M82_07275 [Deltaproteobacteria bacterium]|nr:hypothetical protein [Deltaproteobacteria bacterium]